MRLTHHLAHLLKVNASFYNPDRRRWRCKECVTRKWDRWVRASYRTWKAQQDRRQLEQRIVEREATTTHT